MRTEKPADDGVYDLLKLGKQVGLRLSPESSPVTKEVDRAQEVVAAASRELELQDEAQNFKHPVDFRLWQC